MKPTRRGLELLLVALSCLGCAGQRNEDFIPAEETAHRALEAYLAAWQNGERGQAIPGTSPAVLAADGLRGGGRTLEGFAVLGPAPANAPRCFAVRLNLGNPKAELRERYVVVGIDPLWVYRYEDYEMLTHWSHPMPAATKPAGATPARPQQP